MLAVDQPRAKKARQEDGTEDEDGTDWEVVLAAVAVARNGYALRYAAARLHARPEPQ